MVDSDFASITDNQPLMLINNDCQPTITNDKYVFFKEHIYTVHTWLINDYIEYGLSYLWCAS